MGQVKKKDTQPPTATNISPILCAIWFDFRKWLSTNFQQTDGPTVRQSVSQVKASHAQSANWWTGILAELPYVIYSVEQSKVSIKRQQQIANAKCQPQRQSTLLFYYIWFKRFEIDMCELSLRPAHLSRQPCDLWFHFHIHFHFHFNFNWHLRNMRELKQMSVVPLGGHWSQFHNGLWLMPSYA